MPTVGSELLEGLGEGGGLGFNLGVCGLVAGKRSFGGWTGYVF